MMTVLPLYDGDLNGIITQGFVNFETIVSTNNSAAQIPPNLFDRSNATHWCSKSEPWSFFEIDFIDFGVSLTNYTIKVGPWGETSNYPRQWTVSGFDGRSWLNISNIIESGMNVASKSKTFPSINMNVFFSSLRFTITGVSFHPMQYYHFCADEIEIFGYIGKANQSLFVFSRPRPPNCLNYMINIAYMFLPFFC